MILGGARVRTVELGRGRETPTVEAAATRVAAASTTNPDGRRLSPCVPSAGQSPRGRGDLGGVSATRDQTAQLRRQVSNLTRRLASPDHMAMPGQSHAAQTGGPSTRTRASEGPPVLAL